MAFDTSSQCKYTSPEAGDLLGLGTDSMSWGRLLAAFQGPDRDRALRAISQAYAKPGETVTLEHDLVTGTDTQVRVFTRFYNGLDEPSIASFVVSIRRSNEGEFCPITSLPTYNTVRDRLAAQLVEVRDGLPPCSVLLVEIDDLEEFYDVLARPDGEDLLREVSRRLGECTGEAATLGRLKNGRFVILAPQTTTRESAERLADRIRKRMFPPVEAGGRNIHLTVSVGIVVADGRRTGSEVLKAARLALRTARQTGRSQRATYRTEIGHNAMERLVLEQELYSALRHNQLEVHYQPIVRAMSQHIAGFEALVRWKHPVHGYVSPGRFIPIAEENGLIVELGEWVLRQACLQARRWINDGHTGLFISVNLSARQLLNRSLIEQIRSAREEAGIPAHCIKIELTESAFIDDPERVSEALNTLSFMGFQLALDDFGTGYSSLSYLHQMPFDTLKVDQSFVSALGTGDHRREALIGSIVQMGQALEMDVIAEGVETLAQLEALRQLGCEYAQGWLFSRALPAHEVELLLKRPLPIENAA